MIVAIAILACSLGLIIGSRFPIPVFNKKIEYNVPAEIAANPKEDPLDIEIDAIMAWNDALLNVPLVKRPAVLGETRQ
jgi:hypothetical protein